MLDTECTHLIIKEMPDDERPREKLVKFGAQSLSNAELLGIIIQTGWKNVTAVDLGRQILSAFDNDLSLFFDMHIDELKKNNALKGIGTAKACQIKAAIELGRRVNHPKPEMPQIKSAKDVADLLMDEMMYLKRECFRVLLLDTKHKVTKIETISVGTINASLVHPREVFTCAVKQHAAAIILAHNHPSGDVTPSMEDIQITKRLVCGGEIMGIPVLDHIVIGENQFLSFKEKKMI